MIFSLNSPFFPQKICLVSRIVSYSDLYSNTTVSGDNIKYNHFSYYNQELTILYHKEVNWKFKLCSIEWFDLICPDWAGWPVLMLFKINNYCCGVFTNENWVFKLLGDW